MFIACMAGIQRGGRGKLNLSAKHEESVKHNRWDLGAHVCKDAIVFFFVFLFFCFRFFYVHQLDEHKNPDWSDY